MDWKLNLGKGNINCQSKFQSISPVHESSQSPGFTLTPHTQVQTYTHTYTKKLTPHKYAPTLTHSGEKRMKNLSKSFRINGLQPRTHGNAPLLRLQKSLVTFLLNYASQNALVLPGFQKTNIPLEYTSKRSIWKLYKEQMDAVSNRAVVYSTFCKLWRHLVPYLVVKKPMTDLCWTCQQNSSALTRAVNTPLADKSAALSAYMEHLQAAHKERSFYKTVYDRCRTTIHSHFQQGGQLPPPLSSCTAPNSVDIQINYSFDYAPHITECWTLPNINIVVCILGTLS